VNATSQAFRGYSENAVSTRSDRSAEYAIVARVTQELRDRAVDKASDFTAFAAALHKNQQLWTAFVVDVADPKNPLPADLKARLVYLAEFTSQHSRQILRGKASVLPLLEINMALLRGLKTEGPTP